MAGLYCIKYLIYLFFIPIAHQIRSRHEYLEEIIGTTQDEKYVYWLLTLLSWLLPTLTVALSLLDPVFVFILSKEKQPKEEDLESQSKTDAEEEEEALLEAEETNRLEFKAQYLHLIHLLAL